MASARGSYQPVLILVLLLILLLSAVKYHDLMSSAQEACGITGAAAKLDLSSFVPLCKKVSP